MLEMCAQENTDEFLQRCTYHRGQYNSADDFANLHNKLDEFEKVRFDSLRIRVVGCVNVCCALFRTQNQQTECSTSPFRLLCSFQPSLLSTLLQEVVVGTIVCADF